MQKSVPWSRRNGNCLNTWSEVCSIIIAPDCSTIRFATDCTSPISWHGNWKTVMTVNNRKRSFVVYRLSHCDSAGTN